MQLLIVDYGLGNMSSLKHAFNVLGVNAVISSEENKIQSADAIILPGVGNFGKATENISWYGEFLSQYISKTISLLSAAT